MNSEQLVIDILAISNVPDEQENRDLIALGVDKLLSSLKSFEDVSLSKIDKNYIESLIGEIDALLGTQLDEIVHHDSFQQLESQWRSIDFLVESIDFNENISIDVIDIEKSTLLNNFQDVNDLSNSGLYKKLFTDEYGQFGGQPYGVIIGNYDITPGASDIDFLGYMAGIAAMNHSPFICAADESFFNLNDFSGLGKIKHLESVFEGPQFTKWRALRDSEDGRYIGLTLPRFMLRDLYGESIPVKSFDYYEGISSKHDYLWGNAAFCYATRLAESFAKYRWCPNIIGPQSGGAVENLPIHVQEINGEEIVAGPTEVLIADRREYELAEAGFIPLVAKKSTDSAVFFSSNSIQVPKRFSNDDEGKQAELNFKLGTQLPYLFIINRLAHYVKVLQRENLGSWKSRTELEAELTKWIRQYVADQESPSAATRSQRPLRKATLAVEEDSGNAGWYSVSLSITPHFKFMGANFTLSLTSLLERA